MNEYGICIKGMRTGGAKMKENLFRKESLEKINSPGQLNRYIRVAEPGVWIVLLSIVLLLAGAVVWSVFGVIETKVPAWVVADENGAVCYVDEQYESRLKPGMLVRTEIGNGSIASEARAEFNPPAGVGRMFTAGVSAAELELDAAFSGMLEADVILEQIPPISFLLQ